MEKQEFLKIVSENIKKYRAQNGLTQEKFAEKAGISLPFCAAIETERKAPRSRCGIWRTGWASPWIIFCIRTPCRLRSR